MAFFAHSPPQGFTTGWHLLAEHLRSVAEQARTHVQNMKLAGPSLADAAFAAGLWHDLGKYRPEFQLMLKGFHARNEMTHHKQAGAARAFALRQYGIALAIAGHHGGLPDVAGLKDLVAGPSGHAVAKSVWKEAIRDCVELAGSQPALPAGLDNLGFELWTRLLFSCLVDADWADTAANSRTARGLDPELTPPELKARERLESVLHYIARKAQACRDPKMATLRAEVLGACLQSSLEAPGLFSLSVPTGGGKTLSSLAFALKHAAQHNLRRIIYVAPYLSILEQNADVIRQALAIEPGSLTLFEHHSLAEPPGDPDADWSEREDLARRAENWDAPLIITTSVQFYESLFANEPGRCRKLHNVAGSVVILDECQTLPPDLAAPTCSMLGRLVKEARCTLLLCTATQPAFDHVDMNERLEGVREIIPVSLNLFARLRRVKVAWPKPEEVSDWPDIAEALLSERSALCIVNTRKAARSLFQILKQRTTAPVHHLSTSMCPAHRMAVLGEVKELLSSQRSCFLVSTQLIEAGVDIDFPCVLRELAPLEAIIQSAGRCNREGLLNLPDGTPGGKVRVFRSLDGSLPPDRWYKAGRAIVETNFLNKGREPSIDDPADIKEYFTRLYRAGELDKLDIQKLRHAASFPAVAKAYRLIDEDGIAVVVATWEERVDDVEILLQQVRDRPSKAAFRNLAPFQVNLKSYEVAKLIGSFSEELSDVQVWRGAYDSEVGVGQLNDSLLLV